MTPSTEASAVRQVGRGQLVKQQEYTMPYRGMQIRLRFVGLHGMAGKFRIVGKDGDGAQSIWLPIRSIVLMDDGTLGPQDWKWRRETHKLKLAGYVEIIV